jgi:hypothetical protein
VSLIHGHIRTLKALGESLELEVAHVTLAFPSGNQAVKDMLGHLSQACHNAATTLEKEEMALLERLQTDQQPL